jgi:hypothetical protein
VASKDSQSGTQTPASVVGDGKTPMATDQKYALLFHIEPFQLSNIGKFDLWVSAGMNYAIDAKQYLFIAYSFQTLSLPIMVTVHGSQDCDAQATIMWQRAFGSVVCLLKS